MPFPEYTATADIFTSEEEIFRLFSFEGADLHTDDLDDQGTNYYAELAQRATSQILTYLGSKYASADLASSPRIRELATNIAAYRLSARRGNPTLFREQYEEALIELERYREGSLTINLPQTNGSRTIYQSVIIDNRFNFRPVRIVPQASTSVKSGQAVAYQAHPNDVQ